METSQGTSQSLRMDWNLAEVEDTTSFVRSSTNLNKKKKKKQFNLKMFRRTALAITALACASSIDGAESFAGFSVPLHQATNGISLVQQQQQQQPRQPSLSNGDCHRKEASSCTALMYADRWLHKHSTPPIQQIGIQRNHEIIKMAHLFPIPSCHLVTPYCPSPLPTAFFRPRL